MSPRQLSLRYVGLKMWSDISENLKFTSPYSFGKQKITSCYLVKIPVDFRFICLPRFCKIVLMLLFFLIFYTLTVLNPTVGMLFTLCLLLFCLLILSDLDSMHYLAFILQDVKRL